MTTCTLTVPATAGALHSAAAALAVLLAALDSAVDVEICLAPGVHTLAGQTLVLGSQHNHPHGGRVVWRAASPSLPATISAGAPLTNWWRCYDGTHCNWPEWNGVWAHSTAVPNASAGSVPFRQLWVGGRRAARVVDDASELKLTPTAGGYLVGASNGSLAPSTSWVDDEVELRWPRQIRNWIEPRCVVSAVADAKLSVAPACWQALTARNRGKHPPPPLLIENVVRPPPAGTFASSKQYLFYRPPADAPYAAPQDAWVPLLSTIVDAANLTNHTFVNLTFSHATWRQPSTADGYVPTQSAVTPSGEPVGAVRLRNATGLRIERCAFRNLGSAYALSVGSASQDVAVRLSSFESLSGGALKLGNVLGGSETSADPKQMDARYEISDNVLRGVALEFRGAAAIFAGYVASTTIAHNTIRDTGYTAISLGWGWGSHVVGKQTWARDNHLVANHMSGIMSALNDGGCTYTLGPQPNSTVTRNYCHADRAPVVGSFYHDNGSRYFTTTSNVASTSPAPCVYLQGCCNAPALDIQVSKLWCRDEGAVRNGCAKGAVDCARLYPGTDPDCHCDVEGPTVHMVAHGADWPAEAQAIIDAAGARGSMRASPL